MERSAIYQRALGPIMWWAGGVAVASAVAGNWVGEERFFLQWAVTGVVVVVGAFALARRQARRDSEPFWSLPARKVAAALLPPLTVGAIITGFFWDNTYAQSAIAGVWAMLYGCALHAAGFFAPRGLRVLGWLFIVSGLAWWGLGQWHGNWVSLPVMMGVVFGGLHLGYAIYLTIAKRES
jgi:hypothetical protein